MSDDKTTTRYGGCLASSIGGLLGFVLGGSYGVWEFHDAVDEAVHQGLDADYLPVGVPLWALVGAVAGAVAGRLLLAVLRGSNNRVG